MCRISTPNSGRGACGANLRSTVVAWQSGGRCSGVKLGLEESGSTRKQQQTKEEEKKGKVGKGSRISGKVAQCA
eukprot:IDg6110t1